MQQQLTAFSHNEVKCVSVTAMLALVTYIAGDERCSALLCHYNKLYFKLAVHKSDRINGWLTAIHIISKIRSHVGHR